MTSPNGRTSPFEHVADVGDVGRVLGYPPRALWLGAGGDDDVVGSAFGDESRPHADAVLDRHAEAPALGELVADHVAELGPVRHRRREADLTAGLRALFAHRDPVSVAGGGDRGLEARRSGTGDQARIWGAPTCDWPASPARWTPGDQRFASGVRVLDAPQPAVEPHPSDALLVARQAQADLVGGTGPRLGGELGVGDLPAHDTDEVAVTLGERALGLERVLEATDADHRQVDRLADRGRDVHRVSGRDVHRCLDHEQARRRDPDRRVDVVDLARRLDHLRDADRVVDGRAVIDQLVTADPHAERQPVADDAPDGGHDLDHDPRPVLEAPAVRVGAHVRGRREEAAHDRRVRALQLDPVEATLGAVLGDHRVAGDDLVDLGRA